MSESSPLGLVEGIIIGVLVSAFGAILQFILARKEDQRHSKELDRKKREKAYVKLYAILERLNVNASAPRIVTNEISFKDLQTSVEDNYEVLDQSTIKAWRQKKVSHAPAPGYTEYTIEEVGLFIDNVRCITNEWTNEILTIPAETRTSRQRRVTRKRT